VDLEILMVFANFGGFSLKTAVPKTIRDQLSALKHQLYSKWTCCLSSSNSHLQIDDIIILRERTI
jgi:hypothetical protein